MTRKVFVLGLDGGTPDLLFPWCRAGYLPNFARVIQEGISTRLRSTVHPLTPQAWTTFLTGVNPGRHGIFDFGEKVPGKYEPNLADGRSRKAPALWHMLAHHDRTCGVVNVPLTYPPEPINGFMVTGMHSPSLEQATWPADLAGWLRDQEPQYRVDTMSYWYRNLSAFIHDVSMMEDARYRAMKLLYQRYQPDLFIGVLVGTDRIQHALWQQMEPPHNPVKKSNPFAQAVFTAYLQADRCLGDLLDWLPADVNLMIMSDHGFGELKKDIYLNRFLIDTGYLRFSADRILAECNDPRRLFDDPEVPEPIWSILPLLGNLLPLSVRRRFMAAKIERGFVAAPWRAFRYLDWNRTRAYSTGLFGNIYINLKGREPMGIVEPGRQYDEVRDDISDRLSALYDPEDGKPLVDRVYRREELFHGPQLERAPDLLVTMRDYSCITRGGNEFASVHLVSQPHVNHTGNHRQYGILLARGPDIARGREIPEAEIGDLPATLLHAMHLPVFRYLDGAVHEAVFHQEFLNTHPVSYDETPLSELMPSRPGESDAADQEQLRRRLEGLGYWK